MKLFLFSLSFCILCLAADVDKKELVKQEISRILKKTNYSKIEILEIELGTFSADTFKAKDGEGKEYTGHIWTNSKGQIDRATWLSGPLIYFASDAFNLVNSQGKVVAYVSKTFSVKGKKYSIR